MDEISMMLGELKEFKKTSLEKLEVLENKLNHLESEVQSLIMFKWRVVWTVTPIMGAISFAIQYWLKK